MKTLFAVALLSVLGLESASAAEKFACNMRALTRAERARYEVLAKKLFQAIEEKRELRNGYEFRLPAGELVAAAEWVGMERRCCPFFSFELAQARDGGPVRLRVMGSEGVKPFIRAEFGF